MQTSREQWPAIVLLLVLWTRTAESIPDYIIDDVPGPIACDFHPAQAYGRHQAPIVDSNVEFVVTFNGQAIANNNVCQGRTYSVKMNYPFQYYLMTSSQGSFTAPNPSNGTDACKNRWYGFGTDKVVQADVFIPCSATGTVVLKGTTSGRSGDAYRQNSLTLTIDPSCSACNPSPTTTTPVPTTPTPTTPVPSPPTPVPGPSPVTPLPAARPPSPPPPAAVDLTSAPGSSCTRSPLGYDCVKPLSANVLLHYSYGDSPAPENSCTSKVTSLSTDGPLAHYAVEAKGSMGYVGFSFASQAGVMYNAEAIIGGIDEKGDMYADTYWIKNYDPPTPDVAGTSWAYNKGAVQTSAGTIICFSRRITLDSSSSGRRLLQASGFGQQPLPINRDLQLNWAANNNDDVRSSSKHTSDGGFVLNMVTGTGSAVVASTKKAAVAHGVLLVASLVLCMPTAILLARHRRLYLDKQVGKKQLWFSLHVGLQLLAVALFAAGVAIGFAKFAKLKDIPDANKLFKAHAAIAIVLIIMIGLQLIVSFIRPDLTSARRKLWNLIHHNWGRLAVLLSWANIYIGIKLFVDKYKGEITLSEDDLLTAWLVPTAVIMGGVIITELVLTLLRPRASTPIKQVAMAPQGTNGNLRA